jgi:hypothetical protein
MNGKVNNVSTNKNNYPVNNNNTPKTKSSESVFKAKVEDDDDDFWAEREKYTGEAKPAKKTSCECLKGGFEESFLGDGNRGLTYVKDGKVAYMNNRGLYSFNAGTIKDNGALISEQDCKKLNNQLNNDTLYQKHLTELKQLENIIIGVVDRGENYSGDLKKVEERAHKLSETLHQYRGLIFGGDDAYAKQVMEELGN